MSIMERVSPKTQISPNRMDLYDIKCILDVPPYNQISHPDAESSGNIIKLRFSEKGIYEGEINDNFIPDGKEFSITKMEMNIMGSSRMEKEKEKENIITPIILFI